jgi:ATP-dependent Lon protease
MLVRFDPYVEKIILPEEVGLIVTQEVICLPNAIQSNFFVNSADVEALEKAFTSHKIIMIVSPKETYHQDCFSEVDLNGVGCAAKILQMVHLPEGGVKVLLEGQCRAKIVKLHEIHPYPIASVEEMAELYERNIVNDTLMQSIISLLKISSSLGRTFSTDVFPLVERLQEPGKLADFVSLNLNLNHSQLLEVLNSVDASERLKKIFLFLSTDVEFLQLKGKLQSDTAKELGKTQKDYMLRQQMKVIQKELGDDDAASREMDELRKAVQDAKMPQKVEEIAFKELSRLEKMNPASAEFTVTRTYLDYLIAMPWSKSTEDNLDINNAKKILDEDHYNLEKVKERILEFLAVRKLKGDSKGPILCFVGPPGVGKTSLGKSVARALGRKFIRVSLGGIKDEAEIRGHRRTYVGAMPGRIIQETKRCGTNNPVFILDEVDKIGTDFRGDPSSALLEVLDPEQNNTFLDHYLDVPFDLSKFLFITTANLLDPIPAPLRDRMEVISLPGYTEEEKLKIAEKHLVPKIIQENGLEKFEIEFSSPAIVKMIREYTREAGLRNISRCISQICRKIAKEITQNGKKSFAINESKTAKYLGARKFYFENAFYNQTPGVAIGLAWTESGGDIIFVEATKMKGRKGLILTGYLGEVMKESAHAALSFIRSNAEKFEIDDNIFSKYDIHIHVPQGAIPKDGPSAGITLVVALISLFTGKPVRTDVAMTGEITLTGRVLPIGGIKEKALAARRSGIKKVIMPKKNEAELMELPKYLKKDVTFIPVDKIEDALAHVF